MRLPSRLGSYVAFESLLVPTEDINLGIIDPITFASTNPDELYYHQSMKAPDAKQFARACVEDVKAHHENGHWAVVPRSKIPSGTKIFSSVWAMKRKRRIATREIYKWKSRLNVHDEKNTAYNIGRRIVWWSNGLPYACSLSYPFYKIGILVNWISYLHISRPTPRQKNTWTCLSASTSEVNQICLMHYYLSRTYMEARPAENLDGRRIVRWSNGLPYACSLSYPF